MNTAPLFLTDIDEIYGPDNAYSKHWLLAMDHHPLRWKYEAFGWANWMKLFLAGWANKSLVLAYVLLGWD